MLVHLINIQQLTKSVIGRHEAICSVVPQYGKFHTAHK